MSHICSRPEVHGEHYHGNGRLCRGRTPEEVVSRPDSDQVWSVRYTHPETGDDVNRLGPYFSIQSARNQASRLRGKGGTVLGIDTSTVQWEPTDE